MMIRFLALCSLLLVACGDELPTEPTAREMLVGNWSAPAHGTSDVVFFYDFNVNGTYSGGWSLAPNVQIERGTFSISGESIAITPREWSCSGAAPAYTLQLSPAGLTFGTDVYTKRPTSAVTTSDTTGCFTDLGFQPGPVQPL